VEGFYPINSMINTTLFSNMDTMAFQLHYLR